VPRRQRPKSSKKHLGACGRHTGLWIFVLVFVPPSVLIPSVFGGIEAFTGVRYLEDVTGALFRTLHILLCAVPLASAGIAGLLMVLDRAKDDSTVAGLPSKIVGVSRCASCGASLPVILGQDAHCPFCDVGLVPGGDATRRLEAAARAQVGQEWTSYQQSDGQLRVSAFVIMWLGMVAAFMVTIGIPAAMRIAQAMGWRF